MPSPSRHKTRITHNIMDTSGDEETKSIVPVPAACVACRSRHLKCNGVKPCARCVSKDLQCSFIQSRRGYRRRVRTKDVHSPITPTTASSPAASVESQNYHLLNSTPYTNFPLTNTDVANSPLTNTDITNFTLTNTEISNFPLTHTDIPSTLSPPTTHHLPAYYHYIHPGHPILPPFSTLLTLISRYALPHLLATTTYLLSFHTHPPSTPSHLAHAIHLLSSAPPSGHTVQSHLLLAIGLDSSGDLTLAQTYFNRAIDIALEIGMDREDFAVRNGGGDGVVEESWRRTWWECVVMDGMVAGVHRNSTVRLGGVGEGVGFPCGEGEYISGNIPTPRTLEDFNDDDFSEDNTPFSSFTYRIAAIANLARILALPKPSFPDDPLISKTDAYLVNWSLHLPPTAKLVVEDGRVDEMMFQAYMITYASTILLHQPYANFDTASTQTITSCAPSQPPSAAAETPPQNIHAAKLLHAAQGINGLISLPVSLTGHTHFFTCVVTLAAIVHISQWASLVGSEEAREEDVRQKVRLCVGALKGMAGVWPSAGKAMGQVRGVARRVGEVRRWAVGEREFWGRFLEEEGLVG